MTANSAQTMHRQRLTAKRLSPTLSQAKIFAGMDFEVHSHNSCLWKKAIFLVISYCRVKLVEHTTNVAYWGDGGDGSGKNKLGQILMEVREQLRSAD